MEHGTASRNWLAHFKAACAVGKVLHHCPQIITVEDAEVAVVERHAHGRPLGLGQERDLAKIVPWPQDAHELVVLPHHCDVALTDDVHLQAQITGPEVRGVKKMDDQISKT